MRLIFGVICIILSVFLGNMFSEKYVKRKNFYSDFSGFNKKLKANVSFSKRSLLEIINSEDCSNSDFYALLKKYIDKREFDFTSKYLKTDELDFVKSYFDLIITSDDKTLEDFIDLNTKKLNETYEISLLNEKKYKSLYVKMGFLIGLIATIILL